MIIVCDLDGVLADCSHRLHYIEAKDYDNFYGTAMADDKEIESGVKLLRSLERYNSYSNTKKILLTGRPERTRTITELWLKANCISFDELLMRKDKDYRPSPKVKVELLKKVITRKMFGEWDKTCYYIDDDPENIKAVCEAFPQVVGLTFGIKRMGEEKV